MKEFVAMNELVCVVIVVSVASLCKQVESSLGRLYYLLIVVSILLGFSGRIYFTLLIINIQNNLSSQPSSYAAKSTDEAYSVPIGSVN